MNDDHDSFEQPHRMLFGIKLAPFSWGRRAALQRLLREESTNGEAALAVVWICAQTPERLDAIRGEEAKRGARLEMEKWADENKLTPNSEAERLMVKTADEIYREYTEARFEPATPGGGGGGDPGNALG